MKITSEHVARLLEARIARIQRAAESNSRQRIARTDGDPRLPPDRATFSSLSEDLRIGLAAARASAHTGVSCPAGELRPAGLPVGQVPNLSELRLASLAAQVRAGRYRVPADAIADALLRDCRGNFAVRGQQP